MNILCYHQVDSSIRKLIKSERDLNDSMVSIFIQNLKIVKVCRLLSLN